MAERTGLEKSPKALFCIALFHKKYSYAPRNSPTKFLTSAGTFSTYLPSKVSLQASLNPADYRDHTFSGRNFDFRPAQLIRKCSFARVAATCSNAFSCKD